MSDIIYWALDDEFDVGWWFAAPEDITDLITVADDGTILLAVFPIPDEQQVHPLTDRLYLSLPEVYRNLDLNENFTLLHFLSLIVDQAGELEDLLDRIDYVEPGDGGAPGDTSDLTDPATADAAWLPWLAQLVGARLTLLPAVTDQRAAIETASAGWRAGTKAAMADAARSVLTGTQYVLINDHYTGDQWKVEVRTRPTETSYPNAATDAIIAKRAKPAGVQLVATTYAASWDTLEADRPTWNDWDGSTWDQIENTGSP